MELMKAPFWSSISPRKRKLALWALVLLLLYTVGGFLILPPIIRVVAVKQISKQINREVSIEKIKINPFVLSCTVRGLLIKDTDGEPFVSWDEVYVNFQLSSFFGKAWVFKEISTSKPFVRVQMNKDEHVQFLRPHHEICHQRARPPRPRRRPGRSSCTWNGCTSAARRRRWRISRRASRSSARVGPLDITLDDFRTDPDNKNPYAFSGTTDAGEQISWSGFFYLDPLRSQGELKLFNFALNKYAPLYQDLVRFEIRDGSIALDAKYRFEMNATNLIAAVNDAAFALARFQARRAGRQQQHRGSAALRRHRREAQTWKAARPRWIP